MADEEEDFEEEEEYPPWLRVVVDDVADYWDEVTVLEPGGELPAEAVACWRPQLCVLCCRTWLSASCPCAGDAGASLKDWVEVKVRTQQPQPISSSSSCCSAG